LKQELKSVNAKIQKRDDEIKQYVDRHLANQQKIHALELELQTESHVKNTETYKSMYQTLEKHIIAVEGHNARADKILLQQMEEQAQHASLRLRLEAEHAKTVSTLNAKIVELEDRVAKGAERARAKEKEATKHHSQSNHVSHSSHSTTTPTKPKDGTQKVEVDFEKQYQKYKREYNRKVAELSKVQEDMALYKTGKEDLRNKIRMLENHNNENKKKIFSLEEQLKRTNSSAATSTPNTSDDVEKLKSDVSQLVVLLIISYPTKLTSVKCTKQNSITRQKL
jgi:chromosome segregation ATPase